MDIKEQLRSGRESAHEKVTKTKERIQQAAHDARESASRGASRLKAEGEAVAASQKSRIAGRLAHHGDAMHRAAERLHEEQDDAIAHYVEHLSELLNRGSHYLETQDWTGLRRDAEDVVRRHQPLVFSSMFLLGFGLVRFLKATPLERDWETESESMHPSTGELPEVGIGAASWPSPTPPVAGTPSTPPL